MTNLEDKTWEIWKERYSPWFGDDWNEGYVRPMAEKTLSYATIRVNVAFGEFKQKFWEGLYETYVSW